MIFLRISRLKNMIFSRKFNFYSRKIAIMPDCEEVFQFNIRFYTKMITKHIVFICYVLFRLWSPFLRLKCLWNFSGRFWGWIIKNKDRINDANYSFYDLITGSNLERFRHENFSNYRAIFLGKKPIHSQFWDALKKSLLCWIKDAHFHC